MSKLCSVCGTENRDEAQFCRACGTAFAAASPAAAAVAADGTAANVCAECGFQNKPGIRYCANCGMSLAVASAPASDVAASDAAYAGSGPPPLSYPSFATVSPYPSAPQDTDHSPLFDQGTPDIPDPDAAIALRQHADEAGHEPRGETTPLFHDASAPNPAPNRVPMVIGVVVASLVVAGLAAWIFMGRSDPSPPRPAAASAPVVAAPAAPPTPAAQPTAPIIIEEAPAASAVITGEAAAASAAPAAAPTTTTTTTALPPPPTAAAPLGTPPAAAAPLPQAGDVVESTEADAKRLAAEKRRDKLARDKADREAKAKALADQRDQSAAAQRSEQDAAAARRRADDAQRARPSAAVPTGPAPTTATQARGVREICAGRGNVIAEAVCQSRQCGSAEHANEPVCRALRDADERRRNLQN